RPPAISSDRKKLTNAKSYAKHSECVKNAQGLTPRRIFLYFTRHPDPQLLPNNLFNMNRFVAQAILCASFPAHAQVSHAVQSESGKMASDVEPNVIEWRRHFHQ